MYGNVEDWKAYALARGNSDPNGSSAPNDVAALVRASDYIRTKYVNYFAAPFEDAPDYVIEATYIAASLELKTPNFFTKTYTPSQQKVLTKVGGIQWTAIGDATGTDAAAPVSTPIELLLRRYALTYGAYSGGLAV